MSVRTDTGPFAMIPEWLLLECSANAVKLFALLHRREGKDGIYPSRRLLAEQMKVSESTLDRTISDLEEAGALTVEARFDAAGDRTSNGYALHFVKKGGVTSAATGGVMGEGTGGVTSDEVTKALSNERSLNESSGCARAGATEPPDPSLSLPQRGREVLASIRLKLGERVWYDSPDIEAEFLAFLEVHGPSAVEDAVMKCYRNNSKPYPSQVRRYLPQEESLDRTPHAGRPRIAANTRQPGDFSRPAGRDDTYDLHRIAALHAAIPIGTATA